MDIEPVGEPRTGAEPVASASQAAAGRNNAPFFVVGSGRSGTTLLQSILNGHSRLYIPPETHFIEALAAGLPLSDPLTAEQVQDAVDRITTHWRWSANKIDSSELLAEAVALDRPRMADILNIIYQQHLRRTGKPRWGDKTPRYIRYVPQILAIYPDARFIHLIRDGRDVAISMANVNWGPSYDRDFAWARAVRLGIDYRNAPFAQRILEVRYEDMVHDLEATVRRACAFIGEEFEPSMLDWHRQIDAGLSTGDHRLHGKLYQPILPDAVGVWRSKLTTTENFLIESSL